MDVPTNIQTTCYLMMNVNMVSMGWKTTALSAPCLESKPVLGSNLKVEAEHGL